ncbi:hypothetical protein BOX15_Mlig023024g1 [Macrostomum lignano]|uniref:Uncharacterized protein n=1 Tax=Macrostomum lignano TaxID=282301 RepID=A0A267FCU5_9PLAT|nr:hypothetical protein BOX15_Mlig023024g1 [Macrostomum lignano]
MSEESETLSIVEVKEVLIAAQRLHELGSRMRSEPFDFKESDVGHIDDIIDALHELELHRNKAKDILETETIKCCAVRHKLMHYPDEINREIHEAVKAARSLNEDTINGLKRQLQDIIDEIEYLETHAKQLDAETEGLGPERDVIKLVFEAEVAKLNERLADKAGEQISLNENRDTVRSANVNIVDLEEDVVRLKEQMVVERAQHRETKQKLAEETGETVQKFNAQKEKNDEKKQVLAEVSVELAETTKERNDLTKQKQKLEEKNSSLEAQEADTRQRIERQMERNKTLRDEIERIRQLNKSMTENHQRLMAQMKKSVEDFNEKSRRQEKRRDLSIQKKEELSDVLHEALLVREQDAKTVREKSEELQEARNDLASKAEDIGRLQQEIIDMENRRMELADAHRSAVLTYNKQIAEMKEQLTRERSERMTVQDTNDKLQDTIDKFNKEQNAFTRQMNKLITDLKHENVALNDEHNELVGKIKEDTDRRARLEGELERGRRDFAEVTKQKEGIIDFLERDLERLGQDRTDRSRELEELLPKFAEFEAFFDRTLADYDALKKKIVALKNRKTGLEESSKRTDSQIGQLGNEISELEREKQRKLAQAERQLEELAEERMRSEKDIYSLGCKLKTVLEENARLRNGIQGFEQRTGRMRLTWESALHAKVRQEERRRAARERLEDGWEEDDVMRSEFQEVDLRLLVNLADIVGETEERREALERVTDSLETELSSLDSFLQTA